VVVKAAVVERYGPPEVVSVRDLPDPVAGKGQVVVRVRATTVNSGDARIRGRRFPPGFAVAGLLEKVQYVPEKILARNLSFRAIALSRGLGDVIYTAVSLSLAPRYAGWAMVWASTYHWSVSQGSMTTPERSPCGTWWRTFSIPRSRPSSSISATIALRAAKRSMPR
jgi:hypothetical protein